ncbi:Metaxin-3 [Dactylellina cionopaga]|nr:Metaxin-3 [Dactylellina cionopaga]
MRQLPQTVPAPKLGQWIEDIAAGSVNQINTDSADYRAFTSLIDTSIRDAWLYALYVDPINLKNITIPSYTDSTPVWPINYLLGLQMRQAAIDSIQGNAGTSKITGRDIYSKAEEAWTALGALLGNDKWFFGAQDAGLFDASIFAYTHLIVNLNLAGSGQDLEDTK